MLFLVRLKMMKVMGRTKPKLMEGRRCKFINKNILLAFTLISVTTDNFVFSSCFFMLSALLSIGSCFPKGH